jgi:hypothetical protein
MKRTILLLTLTCLLAGGFALRAGEPPEVQLEFARKLRDKKLPTYALAVLEKLSKKLPPGLEKILPLELARTRVMTARLQDIDQREGALRQSRDELEALAKLPGTPEGAEALFERARVAALLGQTLQQQAGRTDEPGVAAKWTAEADKLYQTASQEFAAAEKALAAPRDKCQARFERGLAFYRQSTFYQDNKVAAKRKRAELIGEARKVLEGVLKDYGTDVKNPTVHLARAWLARCCKEGGDRNAADKHFKELLADTRPETAAGQRWARAFLVVGIPLDKSGVQLVQKEAAAWLSAYPDFRDQPEGALVRYHLASALVLAAQAISKDVHHPEAGKFYEQARHEFADVALLDSEFAPQAREYALNLRFLFIGEKTPLEQLTNFDDCFLKGRHELARYQEIAGRQAKAKTAEERAELEEARKQQAQACVAAYQRALHVATKSTGADQLAEARFLLAYSYLAHGDPTRALEESEALARAAPPTRRSAAAAAYALDVGAGLLTREPSPKLRTRLRALALFVLQDRKAVWQNEPVTGLAHYHLALAALGEKKYTEALVELEQLDAKFRHYYHSRCQLAYAALAARQEARRPGSRKLLADTAVAALNALPPLPDRPEGETAALFFAVQVEAGNLLLEEAAGLVEAGLAGAARDKFGAVLRHGEQLRKEAARVDAALDAKVRGRIARALDQLKWLGELGILRIAYRESNYNEVLKGTTLLLQDVLAQARDDKAAEPIVVPDSRLAGEAVGLALRANIHQGNAEEARKLVLVLRRLADEQAKESVATEVLAAVVRELQAQVSDLRADKQTRQEIAARFGKFLDVLARDLDAKLLGDRPFVLFLAASYVNVDKHDAACKLLEQVAAPKLDPKKKATAQEQRELQEYWQAQGLYGRSLRLAHKYKESRKVLERIVKTSGAGGQFQAQKELNYLLEDEGEWGTAITAWNDYLENPGLRAVLLDDRAKAADRQYAKEQYFDGFYHFILCNYRYGLAHNEREKHDLFIAKAASLIHGLKTHKNPEGWNLVEPRVMELLRDAPELRAAVEKLR